MPKIPHSQRIPGTAPQTQAIQTLLTQGLALHQQGHFDAAEAIYREILAANPDHPDSLHLLGLVHYRREDYALALSLVDKAIAQKPSMAAFHFNRADILGALERYADAVGSYDMALAIKPDYLEAHSNRGIALNAMECYADAIESYGRALALKPDFIQSCYNRANVLTKLGRLSEARVDYEKVCELDPATPYIAGVCLDTQMQLCDWAGFDQRLQAVKAGILAGQKTILPFPLLAAIDDPALHLSAAQRYAREQHPQLHPFGQDSPVATARSG